MDNNHWRKHNAKIIDTWIDDNHNRLFRLSLSPQLNVSPSNNNSKHYPLGSGHTNEKTVSRTKKIFVSSVTLPEMKTNGCGLKKEECGRRRKYRNNLNQGITSFLHLIRKLAQSSILPGLPQIAEVSNNWRKLFKISVLVICSIGFIYQSMLSMKFYYTYPTSVETEIKYTTDMPLPTVTVCNVNGFQRKPLCRDHPIFCSTPPNITEFCSSFPDYCSRFDKGENINVLVSDILSYNTTLLKQYLQDSKDLIDHCCFFLYLVTDEVKNHVTLTQYLSDVGQNRYCYSIDFSSLNKSFFTSFQSTDKTLDCMFWSGTVSEFTLTVVLNVESKQYSRPDINPGIQVAVTPTDKEVNPFIRGFRAKPGMKYFVKLSAIEEHLLPSPYWTNCARNEELDKDYSKDFCIRKCIADIAVRKCNCTADTNFATEKTLCFKIEEGFCTVHLNYSDCYSLCPTPCRSMSFEYDVEEREYINTVKPFGQWPSRSENVYDLIIAHSPHFNANDKAIITITYEKQEIILHRYKPVYPGFEILAKIGGYSGLWLGISLVAILDILESLFVLLVYICRGGRIDEL